MTTLLITEDELSEKIGKVMDRLAPAVLWMVAGYMCVATGVLVAQTMTRTEFDEAMWKQRVESDIQEIKQQQTDTAPSPLGSYARDLFMALIVGDIAQKRMKKKEVG